MDPHPLIQTLQALIAELEDPDSETRQYFKNFFNSQEFQEDCRRAIHEAIFGPINPTDEK